MRRCEELFSVILDAVWPRRCSLCGSELMHGERFICGACVEELPRTNYHWREMNPMAERFAGLVPFERATGHFFYTREGAFASLVQDFKYRSMPDLAVTVGEIAGRELLMAGFFYQIDAIVAVPMHYLKRWRRGYNQAERIACGISGVTGIPVVNVLKARRPHATQTAKTSEERRRNVGGAFKVTDPSQIEGKHVLLVDDICTTGATLTEAAWVLLGSVEKMRISLLTIGVTV